MSVLALVDARTAAARPIKRAVEGAHRANEEVGGVEMEKAVVMVVVTTSKATGKVKAINLIVLIVKESC